MARRYRFTPKIYGRGFVPISREGRLFTLFLVVMIVVAMIRNGLWLPGFPLEYDVNALQGVSFGFDVVLIIFSFSWFMDKKCDGELQWRWGDKIVNDRGGRIQIASSGSKIATLRSQGGKKTRKS